MGICKPFFEGKDEGRGSEPRRFGGSWVEAADALVARFTVFFSIFDDNGSLILCSDEIL